MKIKTDANGFLIGGKAEDWKKATGEWSDIRRDVMVIRSLLEHQAQGAKRSGRASAKSFGETLMPTRQGDAVEAPRPVATPSRRPVPAQDRDSHTGRFVNRSGDIPQAHPGPHQPPTPPAPKPHDDDRRDDQMRESSRSLHEATEALKSIGDTAAHIDPAVAAAREVKEVLQPVGRLFGRLFDGGDPEKKQVGLLTKIWKLLKNESGVVHPGLPGHGLFSGLLGGVSDVAEDGVKAAGAISVFGWLKSKFFGGGKAVAAGKATKVGEAATAGEEGAAAAGKVSLIGRAARFLLGKGAPLLDAAVAVGEGVLSDRMIADNGKYTPAEKTDLRLSNASRTARNASGILAGAAAGAAIGSIVPVLGTAIGGAIGAVLGGFFGPGLIQMLSDKLSPVVADAASSITSLAQNPAVKNATNNFVDAITYPGRMLYRGGKYSLGKISALFESGGRGAGTISQGAGDHGGASYGTYQLSSNSGTLQKFLQSTPYGAQFTGIAPGSQRFDSLWRYIARSDPNFGRAQHDFIEANNYQPMLEALKRDGVNISGRGKAVQEAIWSTAVQFGGESDVVKNALKGLPIGAMTDAQIISAIQGYKELHNNSLFHSSSPSVRASVLSREHQETKALLALNSSSAMTSASVPSVRLPAPAAVPEVPMIMLSAGNARKTTANQPVPDQEVSQNMSDRSLAHIAVGGIGDGG